MQNFKTPLTEVTFRSSKIGLLCEGLIKHGLTDKQKEDKAKLEKLLVTPIGLTEKQQSDLAIWNKAIEEGETLTPSKMEKREAYTLKLTTPKGLTPVQDTKLQELIEKENTPPELSKGAKSYVKEVWRYHEKGFREEIRSNKLNKGLEGEEDAINLISSVDKVFYNKNEKRITIENLTGECDVRTEFKNMKIDEDSDETIDALVIDDTKCSWNTRTFMASELNPVYKWQGYTYLYLYKADIFRLRHCLVNCPPDTFKEEYSKFCFQNKILDDSLKTYVPLIKKLIKNHIYDLKSFNSSSRYYPDAIRKIIKDEMTEKDFDYTEEERVKTFIFTRCEKHEEIIKTAIKLALEYYKTITLNMI